MEIIDKITPHLYALVKKNKIVRDTLKPTWDFFSETSGKLKNWLNPTDLEPAPKGIIESTREWIKANHSSAAGQNSFKEIHPERQIERTPPKTIESQIFWKFRQNYTKTEPATFVAEIDGARVWDEGSVISPDNMLLADVSRIISNGEYVKSSDHHPIFSKEKLQQPLKVIDKKVAVLAAASGRGYYHWMLDVLPRIQLIKNAGISLDSIDKFLINSYVSKFHVETLQKLGISRTKITETIWNPHIRASKLVVPSLVGDTGNIPKWACDFLRQEFLSKASENKNNPKRLYFNRTQVTHRKVTNESDVINVLEKLNFKNISLESLPLQDQISILSTAEVVIVPHGAGLTNIAFCKPGTKIIELLSPKAVNTMYWTLSNQLGLDYYYLFAEGERLPEYVDAYHNSENFSINIIELKEILNLAQIK